MTQPVEITEELPIPVGDGETLAEMRLWCAKGATFRINPATKWDDFYMNERHTWQCRRTKTKHRNGELTSCYYVWRYSRWECTGVGRGFRCDLVLSNLPAVDAYDALPECVQKVVER